MHIKMRYTDVVNPSRSSLKSDPWYEDMVDIFNFLILSADFIHAQMQLIETVYSPSHYYVVHVDVTQKAVKEVCTKSWWPQYLSLNY